MKITRDVKDCEKCIYFGRHATQYPCSHCRNCYTDKFQPNDNDEKSTLQDNILCLIPETIDTDAGTHLYLTQKERHKIAETIADGLIKPFEKMNCRILNICCDDETRGIFEFTKEQFEFLDNIFAELNKNSTYDCMPRIYINVTKEEIVEDDT